MQFACSSLIIHLCTELPWDEADVDCPEYKAWREAQHLELTPWKKIDNTSLSLIRKILTHSPSSRIKIQDIKLHRWYLNDLDKGIILINFFLLLFIIKSFIVTAVRV